MILDNIYFGGIKVTTWIHNDMEFQGNFNITYQVDESISYTESIASGSSILNPTSFTPSKSGYIFAGWKYDKSASNSGILSDTTATEDVTLHALFKKDITVTYYDDSTTAKTKSGSVYYNNGNQTNPSFTIAQADKSGYTKLGWSTGTAGNSSITYNNNTSFTRDSSVTLYGMYSKTITKTFVSYNKSQSVSGPYYYNSNGKTVQPSLTVPTGATYSGWTWRGWSGAGVKTADASVSYSNGQTIGGTVDSTYYGLYSATVTVTYSANGGSGSTSASTGTKYYNAAGNSKGASITLRSSGFSRADAAVSLSWSGDGNAGGNATQSYAFNGWSLGAAGATVTLTSNATATAQWRCSKLYIKFHNDTGINLPWSADSWTTVNLTGLTKLALSTSTWTRDGCDEPEWNIRLGGSTITYIGGNESKSVNIGNRGSVQLRLSHPEVWYNDGYSHGDSTVYLTFT